MDDDLLPIGRFARLTGLTIGALRHYDDLGIVRPAEVDPATGYRRYRRDQVTSARTVARLRDLEVPLDDIRIVLAADDPADQRRRVAEHRSRIEARIARLQRVLHVLAQLSSGREPIVSDSTRPTPLADVDAAVHRSLAVDLFNHTWTLIEKSDRSPADIDEMIHAAHASRFHWSRAGTTVNLARGEWQISRVYAVLGRAEPAGWHARRCLDYTEQAVAAGDAESWDLPFAYEAMARAAAVAGDTDEAISWRDRGRDLLASIDDVEDRELVAGDLATIPV